MTLYLDTSSLVKLSTSPRKAVRTVRAHVARPTLVATCAIAYPEARAALARRRRERAFGPALFQSAKRALEQDWPRYIAVQVNDSVCREAGALAERYALRGYDSVHLASFLALAREAGIAGTEFSSFDERLNRAARLATRAERRRSRSSERETSSR